MGKRDTGLPIRRGGRGKARFAGTIFLVIAILQFFAVVNAANAEPKRVLLLHSFGRDFSPWAEFTRSFRTDLDRKSPNPMEFFDVALMTDRFGANQDEGPFADYLKSLFAKRDLDLIVAIGAPAARFVQQHRPQLFPSTPMLFTAVEQRRVPLTTLTANDTVVPVSTDHAAVIKNILDVLPDTSEIAVVIGASPIEQYWLEQLRLAAQPFTGRVAFTWWNDLSFDETLKRSAALPPRSAIFFFSQLVDTAGRSHEGDKSFASLRAAANAPIFAYIDTRFGNGIVGGPLYSTDDVAQQAASATIRILRGEAPSDIKTAPSGFGTPKFDWRELRRWNISEARLPPGSQIHFRELTLWDQYRWQMTAIFAAILLQAAMISGLLIERRRRSLAEIEAGDRRREAIHLNRVATATVLSSSIAHELNQPLGSILINAETARQMLKSDPPDLSQVDEILSDVIRDDQRASEILKSQKNLLKKEKDARLQLFDLNDSVREVVDIAASEAIKRGVALSAGRSSEALPVRADPIQMQQVMLNLVMNGMDALEGCDSAAREVTIHTSRRAATKAIEVTVSDSGEGIPEDKLTSIFDPFFTTKPEGTGLGLPIARTIVETHGGTIWAENRASGGAAVHFILPLADANPG